MQFVIMDFVFCSCYYKMKFFLMKSEVLLNDAFTNSNNYNGNSNCNNIIGINVNVLHMKSN